MNLETLVTDLQLSKALFEKGVTKDLEVLFKWVNEGDGEWECVHTAGYNWTEYPAYCCYEHQIPALTLAELIEVMPKNMRLDGEDCPLHMETFNGNYYPLYRQLKRCDLSASGKTALAAFSALAEYLLENDLWPLPTEKIQNDRWGD